MQVRGAAAALFLFGAIVGAQSPQIAPPPQPAPPQTAPSQNTAPQNTAEMSSRDAPATFSTKVNLVMVPVVIRDSKGKAIGTLQKEDFQLFDKGKPQVITLCSVEKDGESTIPAVVATDDAALENSDEGTTSKPAGPIAQRFVLYLFD